MLSLLMAYRSFGRFRQASTRLDMPPFSHRHHPDFGHSSAAAIRDPDELARFAMARLDRLASVRLVAQIGAAIGREFSYALLRAVSRLPENELQAALVAAGVILPRSAV